MTRFGCLAVLSANKNGDYVEHREAHRLLSDTARLLAKMNRIFQHDDVSRYLQKLRLEHQIEDV